MFSLLNQKDEKMTTTQYQCLATFREHLGTIQKQATKSNSDGFDIEMRYLREIDKNTQANLDEFSTANKGSNETKNRFENVKPNEGTMVKLLPWSSAYRKGKKGVFHGNVSSNTYINANYVDAREIMGVPFVYIAAQAPLWNTILDFWRMIYENEVYFIVMLCATQEYGKEKSVMYWPPLYNEMSFAGFFVYNRKENFQGDVVYRTLLLRRGNEPVRTILHMQHTSWPDQSVPQASAPLMKMIQTIAASPKSLEAPLLVHCSGGVGRTGVFISLHIALAQFQLEFKEVSIPSIVRFLKLCRTGMVSRKDQYVFLYYATQREMDRMVHSAVAGANVMDLLPQEHYDPSGNRQAVVWTNVPGARVEFPTSRHRGNPNGPQAKKGSQLKRGEEGILGSSSGIQRTSPRQNGSKSPIRRDSDKTGGDNGKGKKGKDPSPGRNPVSSSTAQDGLLGYNRNKNPNALTSRRDVRLDIIAMRAYLRRRHLLEDWKSSSVALDAPWSSVVGEDQRGFPNFR